MADLWLQPLYWNWWIGAVVLLLLEIVVPGSFFLWMGVAAACVGLLVLVVPTLGWEWQWLVFAVLSVASIACWRVYLRHHPTGTDRPTLNRRGEHYVGRTFTLEAAISNGQGKIRVDDSTWKVLGEDCPAGTRVRVTGVDGVVLRVEQAP